MAELGMIDLNRFGMANWKPTGSIRPWSRHIVIYP